jgi:GT2 family glycosyltransferase
MVSFVILHYKNIQDTVECIESIKKLKAGISYSIIVVDNGSSNDNDVKKIGEFTKDIIVLNENVGFAKGNNAGCKYAIDKYNPDFLIVINNDTIIQQSDFLERIYNSYGKNKFDMLGPKILTNGGESVNPFPVYKTREDIVRVIKKTKLLIIIYKSKVLRFLLNAYIKFKGVLIHHKSLENGSIALQGVALHGCAIIFSKKYFKKYKDVFFNDTFLYHEEEFLFQRVIKDSLISLYDPSIEIFHKEGASTNQRFSGQNYEKLIFKKKYIIDSLQKLLNIIDGN